MKSWLFMVVATFAGVGHIRPAPGTWGSLAALPLGMLVLINYGWEYLLVLTVFTFFVGVWVSGQYAQINNKKDPSEVVLDEVAGQWMALVFVQSVFWQIAMAFILFRLLDITKPWLIGRLEKLPGGWGIMADDMLAGLVAGIAVFSLGHFLPI